MSLSVLILRALLEQLEAALAHLRVLLVGEQLEPVAERARPGSAGRGTGASRAARRDRSRKSSDAALSGPQRRIGKRREARFARRARTSRRPSPTIAQTLPSPRRHARGRWRRARPGRRDASGNSRAPAARRARAARCASISACGSISKRRRRSAATLAAGRASSIRAVAPEQQPAAFLGRGARGLGQHAHRAPLL